MKQRTREWLQTFLRLDHRAEVDGIPLSDVRRQEDTVLSGLEMLDDQPGIVLADEVGMGKTYEALGIAAAFRQQKPNARVVILTPGPDLNKKWYSECQGFPFDFDSKKKVAAITNLSDFVKAVRKSSVTIAPVTMFQSGRSNRERSYLISLFCYWKRFHGNTRNTILGYYFSETGSYTDIDVKSHLFLNTFPLEKIESHLKGAFKQLDRLYESEGNQAFWRTKSVRRSLMVARSYIAGKLFPTIDLLIIDEAHKLKNPTSLRSHALRTIFRKRFRKTVFLTATPFQLDIKELEEMFDVFALAKNAPKNLSSGVDRLLAEIRKYQTLYDDFQSLWLSLDSSFAQEFSVAYDSGTAQSLKGEPSSAKRLLSQIEGLLRLKETEIEPGFRKWMIRSLRPDKREYRNHKPKTIDASSEGCLPFLIYERFIAEIFRQRHRTHKAAAEINMVSSYAAAKEGSIVKSDEGMPERVEVYRSLLKKILGTFGVESEAAGDHPKVKHVLRDALDAADNGEKTLIFCSRTQTLRQLGNELKSVWQSRIYERWREIYPKVGDLELFGDGAEKKGRHSLLQSRFHRTQDLLCFGLRESYLQTSEKVANWVSNHLEEIVDEANVVLGRLRLGRTAATKIDYLVTKRCVEHAAAKLWVAKHGRTEIVPELITRLGDADFVRKGLDLSEGEVDSQMAGRHHPRWAINHRSARLVTGRVGSIWDRCSSIDKVEFGIREKTVESLARYMTFRQVPFLTDVLKLAQQSGLVVDSIGSEDLLEFLPRFWDSEKGQAWVVKLNQFLIYFSGRDSNQQRDILDGPIRTGDFARHTEQGQSREKLREAFNTPLFPMVLVANEVMQEGLDLHKQCRRVVHHDLLWNPAQIEQRIGRIDRLGSLTSLMREKDPEVTLDVMYPAIEGTIDERMYRTVKTREKWLEFLLGAPPDFSEYSFDEQESVPLPNRLANELAIDLSPSPRSD